MFYYNSTKKEKKSPTRTEKDQTVPVRVGRQRDNESVGRAGPAYCSCSGSLSSSFSSVICDEEIHLYISSSGNDMLE